MIQSNRHPSSFRARCVILFLGIAVFAVQIVVATHTHADGADHADCPLCLLSGTLQSPSVSRFIPENPLQFSEKAYPAIPSFIGITFPGFHYPSCGPPQA